MGQAKHRAAEIAALKATEPKKVDAHSGEKTEAVDFSSASPETKAALRLELEADRRAQWKGAVEQELQADVQRAAVIRKKISDAKTNYKKEFYGKKFTEIQSKVMQMVAALQRLQAQEVSSATAPHVHDENCNHEHKENEPASASAPT